MKTAYHLSLVETGVNRPDQPKTVDEAVERLNNELNLKNKASIARIIPEGKPPAGQLVRLYLAGVRS